MDHDADALRDFLKRFPDEKFCSVCLAFEFKLNFQRVHDALAEVGQHLTLGQARGPCSLCGQRSLITGLERTSDRSARERVLEFIRNHAGDFFCHACLAQRLELGFGTVQNAVWQLRASSNVWIRATACAACARPRLVVGGEEGGVAA